MMGRMIEACRRPGARLNSEQIQDAMGEFADPTTTIAINRHQAVISTDGLPYFADTVEEVIVLAAEGSNQA